MITLGIGLAVTLVSADLLEANRDGVARQVMDRHTALARQAVSAEATRYVDAVRNVAAAAGSQTDLTRADFQDLTAPLADQQFSGASAVVFVVPAAHDRVRAVEAFWRGRGAGGLTLRPVGAGEHMFSVFERNLDGTNETVTGIDVTQAPQSRAALLRAQRADAVTASDTYQLLRDRDLPPDQQQHSFVIAAPVHSPVGADGRRAFRGWVLMGLRGQDFIEGTLRSSAGDLLGATLVASGAAGPEPVAAYGGPAGADLNRTVTIPVAQEQWSLRTTARSTRLPGGGTFLVRLALICGTAIALLLSVLAFILLSARARALSRVVEATAELRRREQEAREQADLLGTIMDSIGEPVLVVDRGGALVHHNAAARVLVGADPGAWPAGDAVRHPDGSPFPEPELPWIRAARGGEAVDRVELTIVGSGPYEGAVLSASARALRSADAPGAVAVLRDITARKRHEEQLARAADLLERELGQRRETEEQLREQTAELDAFAGIVAHDLKAPLAAVAGYSELLQYDLASGLTSEAGRAARSSVDSIVNGVDRMRRLIDNLLSYATARDAPHHPVRVDPRLLVDQIVTERTAHLRAAGGVPPVIEVVGELPTVRGDPAMVRQLLDNLIGNAVKYTAPGRPAAVTVSGGPRPDGTVELVVADRGIGIPADQADKVFQTFHRAHPGTGYQGTGLGLAICQRIVQRHGGSIRVEPNPGGGSRFRFTLPAAGNRRTLPVID
ncbi:ATP-binding protein [Pilimelia anulata]|uniref:ATP-binding protein n=1 Tax=Pilimelia anulata TaxID=53371 RepID=UPI001664E54A|nr:ATP-binding protein [Pilimelia anulata]